MGLGIRLKNILKEKKVTVQQLSAKTEIPANTLYSIIKRDNKSIQSESLKKIASALGVSIDELLGDTLYIDTVENISSLLSSGKATPENLAKKLKEHHPNTPDDELLRVQQYADKLRDYEKDARHEQAVSLLLALPEEQREAVYTIIKAMSRKE